jgi:hypothetical protein
MKRSIESTKGLGTIVADKITLVYDPKGEILHVHRVTTLQGGKSRSDEEISRAAVEHAKRAPQSRLSAGANVLVVEAHEFKPGHAHRVDVATHALRAELRKR